MKKYAALILFLLISLLVISCRNGSDKDKATADNKNAENLQVSDSLGNKPTSKSGGENNLPPSDTSTYSRIFRIPPPSGPGSGVCDVALTINRNRITATETCGGHDENGHTESVKKLFNAEFMQNHKYQVSKLFNTKEGSSFGCEYFEIKEDKLYLYDENKKIINDWFCKYGRTLQNMSNKESCDCIFLPSEN